MERFLSKIKLNIIFFPLLIGGILGIVEALGVYISTPFLITGSKIDYFLRIAGWYSIFFLVLFTIFNLFFLPAKKIFLKFHFFKRYLSNLISHYMGIGLSFYIFILGIARYRYFFPRWFKINSLNLSPEKKFICGIIIWFIICLIIYILSTIIFGYFIYKLEKKKLIAKILKSTLYLISVGFLINLIYFIYAETGFTRYINKKEKGETSLIILISIDALRPDHLSCYGYEKIRTFNIDQVAQEGVIFRNAYANSSWTFPSLQSLSTSLYPDAISQCQKVPLPSRVITLADILSTQGWITISVLTNPMLIPQFNIIKGFKYNYHTDELSWIRPIRNTILYKVIGRGFRKLFLKEDAKKLTEVAIRYLKKFAGEKVFLWIHYLEPHLPYRDPWTPIGEIKGYSGRFKYQLDYIGADQIFLKKIKLTDMEKEHIKFLYDQDVKYVDKQIGNLFAYLKDNKLWNKALIIITADHGEELFDHNSIAHGHTLHQEVVRVPLLIKFPGQEIKRVIDSPVQLLDLAPTILDYLKYPIPGQMLGRSLIPLIFSGEAKEEKVYSTCLFYKNEAVSSLRDKRYTFIYHYDTGEMELYDRLLDFWEQNNVAEENPELVKRYLKEIVQIKHTNQVLLKKYGEIWSEDEIKKIPIDVQRLRALGYIK